MNTLQIVKRRINALCSGKGQVSLEWMMIAGAVIVLAVLLIRSTTTAARGANATMSCATLKAECETKAALGNAPPQCANLTC